ncbi:MAG: hypothetical protein ACTS2F_07695 [Thainema sp.]
MNITTALPSAALGALVLATPTKAACFKFSSIFQAQTILTGLIDDELDPDGNYFSAASIPLTAIAKQQAAKRDIA